MWTVLKELVDLAPKLAGLAPEAIADAVELYKQYVVARDAYLAEKAKGGGGAHDLEVAFGVVFVPVSKVVLRLLAKDLGVDVPQSIVDALEAIAKLFPQPTPAPSPAPAT